MDNKKFVLDHMKNIGLQSANKLQAEAPTLDGAAIISQEDYIPDFDPSKQYLNWTIGTVVKDNGQVWKLIQPYDSNTYKDKPENMRAQWGLCHTKDPEKAKPYVEPHGQSGMYMKGECCIAEDGSVRRSKIDNNVWPTMEYPDGWEVVEI